MMIVPNRCISVLAAMMFASTASANLVFNGSMTGNPIIGSPPPGWTPIQADGDTIPPGGLNAWATGMPASPDGGTFLALLHNGLGMAGKDVVSQVVNGFTPGESYTVSLFYSNAGLPLLGSPYTGPIRLETSIAGNSFSTPSINFLGIGAQQWFLAQYNFVATAASQALIFEPFAGTGEGGAIGIDGVSIDLIPTPGAAALLGLGGLVIARRRR